MANKANLKIINNGIELTGVYTGSIYANSDRLQPNKTRIQTYNEFITVSANESFLQLGIEVLFVNGIYDKINYTVDSSVDVYEKSNGYVFGFFNTTKENTEIIIELIPIDDEPDPDPDPEPEPDPDPEPEPTFFNLEFSAEPNYQVELWGEGAKLENLNKGELVLIDHVGDSTEFNEIRIYPEQGYEIKSVVVDGDRLTPATPKVDFIKNSDYWYLILDDVVELRYGENLITVIPEVKAEIVEVEPFNIFLTPVNGYRAELWGNEKIQNLPLGELVHVPYDYQNLFEIRLYPEIDFAIVTVNTDADLVNPWIPEVEFTQISSGEYWYLVLDGVVVDAHGEHLMTFTPTVTKEIAVVSPFNKLHLLGEQQVRQISRVAMTPMTLFEETYVNRSIYIIGLLWLPFKISSKLLGASTNVYLGDHETNVKAPLVVADEIPVDLGTVSIPEGESTLDYTINSFSVYLPFIENVVELEPSEVLGKSIRFEYLIDAYDGGVTVNIYDGGSKPIRSFSSGIGRMIPIKTMATVEGVLGGANGVSNNLLSAYIEQKKQEILESDYTNLISVNGSLENGIGYVEIEEIDLSNIRSKTARDNALMILKQGVYINETID